MISFTPLVGGADVPAGSPCAYLLQIDDVNILLDCGAPDWAAESQAPYLDALRNLAPTVDLVLLSHGDLTHVGLYPYARTHWSLLAPIYATLPVQALARISAIEESEQFASERLTGDTCISSPSEINLAFDSIVSVGYSEPTHLQGKCTGLTITPYGAGHSLGGTIWKIRSPSSGTLIYGVDMNHTKERCLDGTVLLKPGEQGVGIEVFEPLARPDVLVTDASRVLVTSARRKDREEAFLQNITATLTEHHSVLIPSDLDSRLLEMLILLDHHWSFANMRYPLCLVSRSGDAFLKETIPSLMEWFGGIVGAGVATVGVGDDTGRRRQEHETLLRFRRLEFFTSAEHLMQTYSSRDPKVIIAVPFSMSYGPSRKIFAEQGIGEGHGNLVLFTRRDESDCWAGELFRRWRTDQPDPAANIGAPVPLEEQQTLKMHAKAPLVGAELEGHLAVAKATREKEAALAAVMERERRRLEAEAEEDSESEYSGSESDDDLSAPQEDQMVVAEPGSGSRPRRRKDAEAETTHIANSFLNYELEGRKSYDVYIKGHSSRSSGFFKAGVTVGKERERFRLFPFIERRKVPSADGYGERIDVSGWLRKAKEMASREEEEARKQVEKREKKEEEVAEVPSKYVVQDFDLNLACNVLYVDLEGLNDGRAVKTILPRVNPRKLIVVKATRVASENLREACSNIRSMTSEIFSPVDGIPVQIGHHTQNFAISLSEELVKATRMSSFEDNDVGYIVGKVDNHVSSSIPILRPLVLPPQDGPAGGTSGELSNDFFKALPQSTFIGDLRLTTLKSQLAKLGISAEFAGEGVLVCSLSKPKSEDSMDVDTDVVAVRKRGKEKLLVEGSPSEVYYTVRQAVYNLHAIVSA